MGKFNSFEQKMATLYLNKYKIYQTEKLIDNLQLIPTKMEICRGMPTKWNDVVITSFEIWPSQNNRTQSHTMFYFFSKNGNSIRYPFAAKDGYEHTEFMAKNTRRYFKKKTIVKKKIKLTDNKLFRSYTTQLCGDILMLIWYIIENKESNNQILATGISYTNEGGVPFLEAEINKDNMLSLYDGENVKKIRIGYKAANTLDDQPCIVVLSIPERAQVASKIREIKVRTNIAHVIGIERLQYREGKVFLMNSGENEATSIVYCKDFIYRVGETIQISDFDGNMDEVCVPGIHFYWDRINPFSHFKGEMKISDSKDIILLDKMWRHGRNYMYFNKNILKVLKTWLLICNRSIPEMPAEVVHYIIEFII
jgi:hypothetical protein